MDDLPSSSLHQIVQQSYQIDNFPSPAWQYKISVMRPNQSGSIEAHLLQAPPFIGCKDNHIWDLHVENPKQEFPCSDRDQLLMTLAGALVSYNVMTCFFDYVAHQEMHQRSLDGLRQLYTVVELFKQLRETRALSSAAQAKTKWIRTKDLTAALEHVTQIVTSLTPEDYTLKHSAEDQRLADQMYDAFVTYGPRDRRYSQTAIYHAMAAILIHLHIEKGPSGTVVERLISRRRKRTKRPKTL